MFNRELHPSKNTYVQRERNRIRKDEEVNERIAELNRMKILMLKAEFENAPIYEKIQSRRERIQQREMELWKISLLQARRQALRRLLEEERQIHITELNKIGVSIYQQRK